LSESLEALLLTGDAEHDATVRASVRATVAEVDRIAARTGTGDPADIAALTDSLAELAPRPDLLRRCIQAVLAVVASEPDSDGAKQLSIALWRLQAGSFLEQAENNQTALEEQYRVDAGMADGEHDPQQLRWLADTHVPAALFASWTDGLASGRLTVVGVHDPQGRLPELIGVETRAEAFPPPALLEAADAGPGMVCIVVPVCSAERGWGLLAIVSEINTASTL